MASAPRNAPPATHCATGRARSGCCPPRWAACCGPTQRWRRRTDGRFAPLPFEVQYDYSYDGIMRSMEDSYQRLGLAKIDILFVHDIGVYQHGAEANAAHMKVLRDSGYRALEELRRTGVVSAIGLGVNEKAVLIEVLGWGEWDAFLLAGRYTLLEQDPLDDLLPMCATHGTSIVVGGPLNSGILAGATPGTTPRRRPRSSRG